MKIVFLIGLVAAVCSGSASAAPFTANEFRQFQQQCRASIDEPWRSIPWKISLLEAQKVAAREKKPIFIWAMDGHPLGCT